MAALGLPKTQPGCVRWCEVRDVDEMVVARASGTMLWLTPHGGHAVGERVCSWLNAAGLRERELDAGCFPEARSEIEARAMWWLARAASPRAVALLLVQHERWVGGAGGASDSGSHGASSADDAVTERDRGLRRLIEPPMVVAVGAPNAGKSTLLNALAGQGVAVVSEVAGTTLDHVGALIELDGVVVRWVDTPGIEAEPSDDVQAAAQAIAKELASRADLVVCVVDARTSKAKGRSLTVAARSGGCTGGQTVTGHTVTLASKLDLVEGGDGGGGGGGVPDWADVGCCALNASSVAALAIELRRLLVCDAWLASDEPWRFWG